MVPASKSGLKINAVILAMSAAVFVILYAAVSRHAALSYFYGACSAQIFSLSWFLVTAPLMQSDLFLAAAIGGFFVRAVFLALLMLLAYKGLGLLLVFTAPAFLSVRFILIGCEIFISQKK